MKLAISTCPNDTFAFHAILNGKIDLRGLDFQIELLDIQQLNDGLREGQFDVAKASFHAALRLTESTIVLPSGSALGFGVGPLLLACREDSTPLNASCSRTLCPGELTTATMLFKMFYASPIANGQTQVEHGVFSEIMPALQRRAADFGVCIHEGRFTWQDEGLFLVEDLGVRWEKETGAPLPLGGILARRDLGRETLATVSAVIKDSIEYAHANRTETLPTMRQYAQEFSDEILFSHVDLYVNQWTLDMGDVGRNAIRILHEKAIACGLVLESTPSLEVY